jgi:hypothetical protein
LPQTSKKFELLFSAFRFGLAAPGLALLSLYTYFLTSCIAAERSTALLPKQPDFSFVDSFENDTFQYQQQFAQDKQVLIHVVVPIETGNELAELEILYPGAYLIQHQGDTVIVIQTTDDIHDAFRSGKFMQSKLPLTFELVVPPGHRQYSVGLNSLEKYYAKAGSISTPMDAPIARVTQHGSNHHPPPGTWSADDLGSALTLPDIGVVPLPMQFDRSAQQGTETSALPPPLTPPPPLSERPVISKQEPQDSDHDKPSPIFSSNALIESKQNVNLQASKYNSSDLATNSKLRHLYVRLSSADSLHSLTSLVPVIEVAESEETLLAKVGIFMPIKASLRLLEARRKMLLEYGYEVEVYGGTA